MDLSLCLSRAKAIRDNLSDLDSQSRQSVAAMAHILVKFDSLKERAEELLKDWNLPEDNAFAKILHSSLGQQKGYATAIDSICENKDTLALLAIVIMAEDLPKEGFSDAKG